MRTSFLILCALAFVLCVTAQANVVAPKKPSKGLKWSCKIGSQIYKRAFKEFKQALPQYKTMHKLEKLSMKKIMKKRISKLVKKNMPKQLKKKCQMKKPKKNNKKMVKLLIKKFMKKSIPKKAGKKPKSEKKSKKSKKSVQKEAKKPLFPKELKTLLKKTKTAKKQIKKTPKKKHSLKLPKKQALKLLFKGKPMPQDTKKVLEAVFHKHLNEQQQQPAKKVEEPKKVEGKPVQAKSDSQDLASCVINWARNKVGGCYSQSSRWGPCYDCSSFAYSAYKACGYDIGAQSSGAYPGKMRSVSSPQPGDILWKSGHVAIYTGSGVVHAENERTGIRERDMNYFNSYFGYTKVYRL